MKRSKWLALLSVLSIVSGAFFIVSASPSVPVTASVGQRIEETTEYSNEFFRLIADPQTAEIQVVDNRTGHTWYSNPADKENETVASGFNKMNMYSQLVVSYLDKNDQTDSTNNYVGSIRKSDFYCEQIQSGFRFVFTFPSEGFVIPVEYTLSGSQLICNIPLNEVQENGESRLTEIQLLPYFGAGANDEEGYLLIPDGCGALIEFGCSLSKAKALTGYKGYVYGRDPVLTTTTMTGQTEVLTLPMFGIKKAEGAFLAIIESGDGVSQINAVPNNKESSYATASPTLVYRNTDNATLREMKSSEKTVLVFDETPTTLDSYTVSYSFLGKEEADYSGMARVAREYYEKNGMSGTAAYTGMYLELTAGDRMADYFFGIPIKRYTPFTTLTQAQEMLSYFNKNGIDAISVKYDSVFSGGEHYKMAVKAKVERKVQDISLKSLLSTATESGNRVFPTVDLLKIHTSGNGVSKNSDSVRNVSGGVFNGYTFLRSTSRKDMSGLNYTIAKASVFAETLSVYLSAMAKQGIGNYADLTSGNLLPSDHHRSIFSKKDPVDRQQALDTYLEAYGSMTASSDNRLFDDACGYVFPYATDLTSLPMQSSRYELFSKDVPFVQMVVHGRVAYSSQTVNLCDDPDQGMLKCLEFGSVPLFSLVYEGTELLAKSNYNDRFSSNYAYWKERIVAYNAVYEDVLRRIAGSTILCHTQVQDDVYRVDYANGISIVINYSDSEVTTDGHTVAAGSFEVWEG